MITSVRFFIAVLFITSCKPTQLVVKTPQVDEEVNKEIVSPSQSFEKVSHSTYGSVQEILEFFTSDELLGRDSGSPGLESAADFAINIFKNAGLEPMFHSFQDTLVNFEPTTYNVVGVLKGTDADLKNEIILIGAHYDHIGQITAVEGDAIANGANDNASGTTVVLEMARYFGQNRPKRTLVFALFSAEEKGLKGSAHLAKKMKEEGIAPYAMLNFEMVGVPLQNKDYLAYITGYDLSNLAEVGNELVGNKLIGFLPTAKEFNLFKRSDNYPFYQEFGIPAHTFCTFDFTNFNHYHKVSDELDKLDLNHVASFINTTLPLVEDLANEPVKIVMNEE